MIRVAMPIVLGVLASGCVGVGIYADTQFNISQRGDIIEQQQSGKLSTKEQILGAWGEPKSRHGKAGEDVWTYTGLGETAWRGIVIWILAPVPLLLPVGRNDVQVEFDSEEKTKMILDGEVEADFYGCNIGLVCGVFDDVTHVGS